MFLEYYINMFDLKQQYTVEEIKKTLLDNKIKKEQIEVDDYNICVKNAYKNETLCINISLSTIYNKHYIKDIYFIPIAISLADINNPYDYHIRK